MSLNCQKCQINLATVKVTQVINGERTDIALCQSCAESLGMDSNMIDNPAEIAQLIANAMRELNRNTEELPDISCTVCETTFKEFTQSGLLGCSQCYNDFSEYLKPMIRRYHGVTAHKIKKSRRKHPGDSETRLAELQSRMKKALAAEDFETAAQIRDELKQLEK